MKPNLTILGKSQDQRTESHIIYGQITIEDYLVLIGSNFDKYGIQRRKEKHKAYKRMKQDIIDGAQLPAITLAVNQNVVQEVVAAIGKADEIELKDLLSREGNFSILDGLQRTYILNEIKNEGHLFNPNQKLLLEFWAEPDIKHLIYRLIVLNAGQKPMSMRHQLELLFLTMAEKLKSDIAGLDIFVESESRRRTQPKQYPLDRLVEGYQAYLWKTQELSKDNIVAQQMLEFTVLDSNEETLNVSFESFKKYLKYIVKIDEKVFDVYRNKEKSAFSHWIASENVIVSFFGAISDFSTDDKRRDRVDTALERLVSSLSNEASHSSDHDQDHDQDIDIANDPLGLTVFNELIQGIQVRKVNVGVATRKLLFNGFKEFFRDEGEKNLRDCWLSSVD